MGKFGNIDFGGNMSFFSEIPCFLRFGRKKSRWGQVVCQKPYVIEMDGQVKTLLSLTGVGTWSKKGQKHPYVIKEQPLAEI